MWNLLAHKGYLFIIIFLCIMQFDLIFHASILVHLCFIVIIPLFLHYCLRALLHDEQYAGWQSLKFSMSKLMIRRNSCQRSKPTNESVELCGHKKERKSKKSKQDWTKSLEMPSKFTPNAYSFNVANFIEINQEVHDKAVSGQKSTGRNRPNNRKANRSRKAQFSNALGLEIINQEMQEQINL